jgi:hypothetical protein
MNIVNTSTRRRAVFMAAAFALFGTGVQAADLKLGKAGELEIKGDLRLRQESGQEMGETAADNKTYNRQRFRLRVGMNYKIDSKLSVKTRLASGTGEQTSTNQTMGNNASQKAIWIDQAYLEFKAIDGLTLFGGRMENNMWQAYSSDIVWDTDYNPEGLAESLKVPVGSARLFVNALQSSINEDKSGSAPATKPQYLFSNQVGVILPAPMDSRITLAGAIHSWVNESSTWTTITPGNTKKMNTALNDIRVNELSGEIFTTLPTLDLPLSLQGTYIKNTASKDTITPNDNTGYQWGGILGKADKKSKVEVAFFRKSSGKDSTKDDVADSDFPGTDRVGNIYWVAYGVSDVAQLKAKYFDTKKISAGKLDKNLLQIDLQVKF